MSSDAEAATPRQPETCAHKIGEPETGSYFVSTYPPFSCWNDAGLEDYRHALAEPATTDTPLGLYVHIPFCVDRCHYCYYLSSDDKLAQIDEYLEAITHELALYASMPALTARQPTFVYCGGGTPSLLSTTRIERLLAGLQESFSWEQAREVSFECAPRSVTEAKLRALRRLGVSRISLGVQQMNDRVLEASGRVHLVHDVERAYGLIRQVGFDVVNVDLMVGMVGETEESYIASLDKVIAMAPDTVTTYQLEIPLNTPLWRSMRDGTLATAPASWEQKHERLQRGMTRLEQAGYTMTSVYAAALNADRHRFVYQTAQYHGADLLGIGCSAFSHLRGINQQNQASLAKYLATMASGELPLWRAYALSDTERMLREFVLQLKLGGALHDYFRDKFAIDPRTFFRATLAMFESQGLLTIDDSAVRVTRTGSVRIDRMIPAFYLREHQGVRYS